MLKSYDPIKSRSLMHIVEATYMFGEGKVVVNTPIESECAGADLLNLCVDDSDWVSELDDFGEFNHIQLTDIKRLQYDDDIDELAVFLTNGKILTISGDDVRKYLVKVEIVSVNNESLQSCQGKKLGAVVETGGAE